MKMKLLQENPSNLETGKRILKALVYEDLLLPQVERLELRKS